MKTENWESPTFVLIKSGEIETGEITVGRYKIYHYLL